MTPRTLFIIILRVLGLLSLQELIYSLTQLITLVASYFQSFYFTGGLFMVFIALISVALTMAVSYYLIFKADFLVSKLGLHNDIREEVVQLNINLESILRIALIVTAALILIREIPHFLQIIYAEYQKSNLIYLEGQKDWSPIIASGVKIIIAFLIIGERNRIIEFLSRSKKSIEIPQAVDDQASKI